MQVKAKLRNQNSTRKEPVYIALDYSICGHRSRVRTESWQAFALRSCIFIQVAGLRRDTAQNASGNYNKG